MLASQTKHTTEIAARAAARTLGKTHCQIIESRDVTKNVVKTATGQTTEWVRGDTPVFYLEHGAGISMIRGWEAVMFEGKGRDA